MAKRYKMTPKRRAALKKAQIASAKQRKRNARRRVAKKTGIGAGVGVVALVGGAAAYHKASGSQFVFAKGEYDLNPYSERNKRRRGPIPTANQPIRITTKRWYTTSSDIRNRHPKLRQKQVKPYWWKKSPKQTDPHKGRFDVTISGARNAKWAKLTWEHRGKHKPVNVVTQVKSKPVSVTPFQERSNAYKKRLTNLGLDPDHGPLKGMRIALHPACNMYHSTNPSACPLNG